MPEKITLDELRRLKKEGVRIVNGATGEPFDFESVEKNRERSENREFLKTTHTLVLKAVETMNQMVAELQKMNLGILNELKKFAPREPKVTVEPKIDVTVPEKLRAEWEHEVVEMTQTGRPVKIISTPRELK